MKHNVSRCARVMGPEPPRGSCAKTGKDQQRHEGLMVLARVVWWSDVLGLERANCVLPWRTEIDETGL